MKGVSVNLKDQITKWNIVDVIVSVFILLLLFALYVLLLPVLPKHENFQLLVTVISYFIAIVCILKKYKAGLLKRASNIRYILIGIFLCGLFFIPYLNWLSNNSAPKQYLIIKEFDAINIFFYLFVYCLVIPFEEEILFRGLYYRIVKNRYDVFVGTVVSIALFSLNHAFQGIDLISITLQGLIYTYVYQKTGSVWSSVMVHSFNNSFWFLMTYLWVR